MISPYKIGWNGEFSHAFPFNITTCLSFDGDSGDIETHLGREAVVSETYNGALKRGGSYKWSESMSPSITIMKTDFSDFTREENRKILSWLTGRQTPGFLDIYMNSDITVNDIEYSILGNFISVSQYKLGNSRVVGYVAQFESVNPWAWSCLEHKTIDGADLTKYEKKDTNTGAILQIPMYRQDIDINTDEPESAIYPRITIKQNNSVIVPVDHPMISNNKWVDDEDWLDGVVYYYGATQTYYYQKHYTEKDENNNMREKSEPTATQTNPVTSTTKTGVIIKNTYVDGNSKTQIARLKIINNSANEIVVLDGANRVVSSWSIGTNLTTGEENVLLQNSRIFGDSWNWSWLPLYNGKNTIEVIGNCIVEFEYREVRKIGEF